MLLDNMFAYSFLPSIGKPTRLVNQSATLIHHIFIKSKNVSYTSAIVYNDISDHFPIVVKLEFQIKQIVTPTNITKRSFSDRSVNNFKASLNAVDWESFVSKHTVINDPEQSYKEFNEIYKQLYDEMFPLKSETLKSCKNKPRHKWITASLAKSCETKAKFFKRFKKNPTIQNELRYKVYRNKLKTLLIRVEKKYYDNKFEACSGDIRQYWKTINTLITKKPSSTHQTKFANSCGQSTDDPIKISENFNSFFTNIGTDLAAKIPATKINFKTYLKKRAQNSLFLLPTSPEEIESIVNLFNNKKSAGVDDIGLDILIKTICTISKPFSFLINQSLQTGKVPDAIKVAKVVPIFKNGSKSEIANYRPISVLPSFSKVYEKVISNRMISFLSKNEIINSSQYGFRSQHSTYMALLDFYDKITESIEANEYTVGVFIDLQKAFDTIDHSILLTKLEFYGIRGTSLEWIKNYLQNRKQYVKFNGISSSYKNILCGVPQGSILGPLLFIIYINDIQNCSNILHFILFADDTNLI